MLYRATVVKRLHRVRRCTVVALSGLVGIALVFALSVPARAVVISIGNGQGNTGEAASNPFWINVARMSSASAVYLGNRWVITANHVSDAPVHFSNGTTGQIVPGSDVTLTNPASANTTATPDLRMFRLTADPGFGAVTIPTASPTAGVTVMMIGAGFDRAPNEIGWTTTSGITGDVWKTVPIPLTSTIGFNLESSSHMRWGMNNVESGQLSLANGNTVTFSTRFDRTGLPFEAQGAVGDSGGGVFRLLNGTWQLAGLMESVTPSTNQPSGTVVFGNHTLSANLATYRDQIVSKVARPDPAWQNQLNYFDVNHSGDVTALDELLVINALAKQGNHDLTGRPGAADPFVDVSGDNFLSSTDVALLRNFLTTHQAGSASAQTGTNFIPEPSGMVLAALGLMSWLALTGGRALVARLKKSSGAMLTQA